MSFLNFQNYSLWINAAAFLVCGAIVWYAGAKLAGYLDKISEKTGLGQAFVGLLLLGGITSLPEVATVATASYSGNAPLAVNNLLGSVAINVVLLAVADLLVGRDALTAIVAKPSTLLQGTLDILMLAVVAAAVVTGDVAIFGVGVWSMALVPLFVFAIWLSSTYGKRAPWVPDGRENGRGDEGRRSRHGRAENGREADKPDAGGSSLKTLIGKTAIAAVAILAAGFVLAKTGDAIAARTGLGAGLVGLILVGFATSLPEVSSIYGAVRLKRYEMAIGDIFGTNLFDIVLIFLADVIYTGRGGSQGGGERAVEAGGAGAGAGVGEGDSSTLVLNQTGPFEAVATLLAIILTCLYLLGLLERKNRTIFRMGYDSLAVILIYIAGLVLLYFIQGSGGT